MKLGFCFILISSFILLVSSVLAGCGTGELGRPDKLIDDEAVIDRLKVAVNPDTVDRCQKHPTETCRNEIVYNQMLGIDILFDDFQSDFIDAGRDISFFSTVLSMGINTAATVYGTQLLSLLAVGLSGAKEAYDSEFLMNKAVNSLVTEMRAQRSLVKVRLLNGIKKPLSQYPLALARMDLQAYYMAGTLLSAYNGMEESATHKVAEANEALEKTTTARYVKTASSEIIAQYLRDADGQVHPGHVRTLDQWLQHNRIPMHASMFMNADSPEAENNRRKAITELINP